MKVTSWCFRSLVWIPFLCCLPVFGQIEMVNWVMGDSVHVRFMPDSSLVFDKIDMYVFNTANISSYTNLTDSNKFIFINDGFDEPCGVNRGSIRNQTGNILIDSTYGVYQYANSYVIIPVYTSSDTIIYFIQVVGYPYHSKLHYSNGSYTLEYKNQQFSDSLYEDKWLAVPRMQPNEWWLISHRYNYYNRWEFFIVDSAGIHFSHFQDIGQTGFTSSPFPTRGIIGIGEIATNREGNKIAIGGGTGFLNVFDFDRCTGILSSPIILSIPLMLPDYSNAYYGVALSASGKRLYVTGMRGKLFQFDMTASDVLASRTIIYSDTTDCYGFGQLEMGPDGNIYIASGYNINGECTGVCVIPKDFKDTMLSVIRNPEGLGTACDFQPWSIPTGGIPTIWGLPNFPAYSARAYGIDSADAGPDTWYCPGGAPVPIGSPPKSGQVFAWSPSTGLSDPTAPQPFASPSVPTLYVLTVTDTNAHVSCNVTSDSVWVFLESPSAYTPTPLDDTLTCLNAVITLGADSIPGFVYSWIPATGLSNANSPRPQTTVTDTILYTLTVHDPAYHSDCGTWTDSLTVMPDTGCIAPHTDNPLAGRSLGAFFPNPGTGVFFIDHSLQPGDVLSVTCTDLTGREVSCSFIASGSHRHILTLDVPAGVYLAEIKLNNLPVRRVKLMVE